MATVTALLYFFPGAGGATARRSAARVKTPPGLPGDPPGPSLLAAKPARVASRLRGLGPPPRLLRGSGGPANGRRRLAAGGRTAAVQAGRVVHVQGQGPELVPGDAQEEVGPLVL